MKPGDTFSVDGESYTVVYVVGANVVCTRESDKSRCLIALVDAKKGVSNGS